MLVNVIEKNLCRIGIVNVSHLLGKDLFAPGREISVKEGVSMNYAGVGGSGKLWEKGCGKEKVWAGCNESGLVIPWIVCCD